MTDTPAGAAPLRERAGEPTLVAHDRELDEAYRRLDTFATHGPDPDIETLRRDVFVLLGRFDVLARLTDARAAAPTQTGGCLTAEARAKWQRELQREWERDIDRILATIKRERAKIRAKLTEATT